MMQRLLNLSNNSRDASRFHAQPTVTGQHLLILLLSFSVVYSEKDDSDGCKPKARDEINDFINGLCYSSSEVLAYEGDGTGKLVHNQGSLDKNKNFIVVTREVKSVQNKESDIGVVASNEHQTYPGALLLANQRLMDNIPDILAIDRAPVTYTVNLPGLIDDDNGFTIVPSFNDYHSSLNKVLKTWFEKSPDQGVVANFQSEQSFAYSDELLRVKFGMEFKNTVIESNIDFEAVAKQQKLIMVYKFKQIFYTVSVEPTKRSSDLFPCNVTVKDLKSKTNEKNPPVIVDSVSYGRTIYVKLETSSTDNKAKALLETKITNNANPKLEMEYKKNLQNLSMQAYVIGGSSNQINLINAKDLTEVNEIIVKNSKFGQNNLGYPISYSAQFIKDNSRAIVNMATKYIETTRSVHKKGTVEIVHHGWYVAKWNVTWKEISFDESGKKIEKNMTWEKNGKKLTAPFEEVIQLPGNTENIKVIARCATGLPWQFWRTLINSTGIPLVDKRKFLISGTTLTPKFNITPAVE